jgi:hypothetical protein
MTGHLNKDFEDFNQILWPDAELELISIDYDKFSLKILQSNGHRNFVHCTGYIGYEHIGIWDEIVIDNAIVYDKHELIDRCKNSIKKRVGNNIPDSGSSYRNKKYWCVLSIKFIDGSELNIASAGINIELIDTSE